ncbi:hypothetical protein VTK56DRAFT_7787 [Thermocarpiscus australiensis]
MKTLPTPGSGFVARKAKILSQLAVPDEEYTDASPKGSVDANIRHLIDQINGHAGLVTTSSCAGRVSVYLEGRKTVAEKLELARTGDDGDGGDEQGVLEGEKRGQRPQNGASNATSASSAGGKGGGEWLFVSHDPVEVDAGQEEFEALLGLQPTSAGQQTDQDVQWTSTSRLIHFKFEPMILHILTASPEHAQLVIQAGMEAGFRETGAVGLIKRQSDEEATPMVAVRSMGLSFESLIGAEIDGVRRSVVSGEYLRALVQIANARFVENQGRIARFSAALDSAFASAKGKANWEDAEARRERKRQEGLKRREELKKEKGQSADQSSIDLILEQPDVL